MIYVNNQAQIKSPKSSSGVRSVPIPDTILEALKQARKCAESTIVCPAADGRMMSHVAFNRAWRSYLNYLNTKAGGRVASRSRPKLTLIDNITPHMFRHTYATILYNAGVDIKSAQRFLGHSDINVTLKIYTHLSTKKEQEAIDSLNKHLNDNAYEKNLMQ